jgi:N-carbamoyl-L-amino-acid hydrolase
MTTDNTNALKQPACWVDATRLAARIDELGNIGAYSESGVDRQALTVGDAQAQTLLIKWAEKIGMSAQTDAIGNLFLRLSGTDADASPVMAGSHIDTQPTGGKYDGAYGVIAALEAAQAIALSGHKHRRPIDVVAWMNEEGSRFAPGMTGSAVYAGVRSLEESLRITDAEGVSIDQALQQVRTNMPPLPGRELRSPVAVYLEPHIEQGTILETAQLSVGVVTTMQGKLTFRVTVQGEAAHAGTVPLLQRKDALLAALRCIDSMHTRFHDPADIMRLTVGRFDVSPGAPSVVPSQVVFSIDIRHPDDAHLQRLGKQVSSIFEEVSSPCTVQVEQLSSADSLDFDQEICQQLVQSATSLGIGTLELASSAGHDSRYLSMICPTAMLFIQCRKGETHNDLEYAAPSHMADGARVLAHAMFELAK